MTIIDDTTLTIASVAAICLIVLAGLAMLIRYFKKRNRQAPDPTGPAFDQFNRSLLHVQRQQNLLASDLADLKRKHDGLADILLAFIEDLETSKHRLEILQLPDDRAVKGALSFYDPKLAAVVGALDVHRRADLLTSEAGFTRAEIEATERYTTIILNRIVAVRGAIAHTQLKLRKSGYVALLRQMDNTFLACENRLAQLNEPAYVALYEGDDDDPDHFPFAQRHAGQRASIPDGRP